MKPKTSSLQELLRKRLAEREKAAEVPEFPPVEINPIVAAASSVPHIPHIPELIIPTNPAPEIIYNKEQQEFIDIATSGRSVALSGSAGTGKTTVVHGACLAMLKAGKLGVLEIPDHKYLRSGTPGIVLCSFTNKAVNNLKKRLPKEMKENCISIHKLLEFEPVYEEVMNPETMEMKRTMKFQPKRNALNPLPASIRVLVIEEASMLAVDLWNQLAEALLTKDLQVILIGDLQQLPPVFGKSIFIHAFQQGIATVELTQVYRQALESPIIALATRIISGKQIPEPELASFSAETPEGRVLIKPWKQKLSDTAAIRLMTSWLPQQIDTGTYDPEYDVIITPYNKSFGTVVFNQIIASHLAKKYGHEVHEIFAGIKTVYFRVGERVLYNKSEAFIKSIERNPKYFGKLPRPASKTMSYNGVETGEIDKTLTLTEEDMTSIEDRLASLRADSEEKTVNQASAKVTIYIPDFDKTVDLYTAGEIGSLDLGYAITVHKSQGSEYERVFFITHGSQATMLSRELVYTAVTRAKKELIIVGEPNLFVKSINSQRLPGNSIAEKIKNFERELEVSKKSETEMPIKTHVFKYSGTLS